MLNDPSARQRMGTAGRARVEKVFGVERLVEGTLAAYRQVLARNPTTQAAS
jgi:glycosyltransferase involved in cell wall biosynthesis